MSNCQVGERQSVDDRAPDDRSARKHPKQKNIRRNFRNFSDFLNFLNFLLKYFWKFWSRTFKGGWKISKLYRAGFVSAVSGFSSASCSGYFISITIEAATLSRPINPCKIMIYATNGIETKIFIRAIHLHKIMDGNMQQSLLWLLIVGLLILTRYKNIIFPIF